MTDTENLEVYDAYIEAMAEIRHFDLLQTYYRTLALKCMLATFAAIGFLLSLKPSQIPFNPVIAIIFICVLSIMLNLSILITDLIFKERLLISAYADALRLEHKYDWLPKIHTNMLDRSSHHGAPSRKILFYIGCNASLFLVMGAAFSYLFGWESSEIAILIGVITLFMMFLYIFILIKISGKFESFVKIALENEIIRD